MKNLGLFIALLSWFSFLFSACQPLAETNALEPTNTESISITSTVSNITNTPKILLTATFTQEANNCIADNKLPEPDLPENYIGWKPGVDFSELYSQENGDGDYMYWESLLDGHKDFAVAGYKRSDNSYMIFVEKLVCRDVNSNRVYEVVEAIRTRRLSDDEDIGPLNFECYRFGEDGEEEVLAIVNKTSGNAVFAWSIDVENKVIEETSLEGITCFLHGIIAQSK